MTGFVATIIPEKRQLLKDLTPASGRQDHATSPCAQPPSSGEIAAPIASRPNVDDDGQRPSTGTGPLKYAGDLASKKTEIFLSGGLDSPNQPEGIAENGVCARVHEAPIGASKQTAL